MYKVTITSGGTTATAFKHCRTKKEAERVKGKAPEATTNAREHRNNAYW